MNKFKVLYVAVLCGGPTDERGGLSPQKIMTVLRNEIVNLMKQKRRTDWQLRREGGNGKEGGGGLRNLAKALEN